MSIIAVPKPFIIAGTVVLGFVMVVALNIFVQSGRQENMCRIRASLQAMEMGDNGMQVAQQMASCVAKETGWAGSAEADEVLRILAAMPIAPCRYQGDWIMVRKHHSFLIRLAPGGKFKAWPIGKEIGGDTFSGNWSVFENKFVWMPASTVVWPLDINKMRPSSSEDAFTLEERNGDFSHYFRISEPVTEGCTDKP
ncbi:hypothetical protein [Chitinimonas sp. BJYL2]|uniref:hypothetical protein n=1 Tax=Chitinimonas sp. BJYL2 TaxID=2976696 RepID=UPI0022B2DC76|nr:hypothetical protein [Chitinimonas sp. BJYL2]